MTSPNFIKLRSILEQQLGVEQDRVTPDAKFVEDLGADSLDTVELVMAVEEEWGVDIDDETAERLKTVQDVVTWLDNRAD